MDWANLEGLLAPFLIPLVVVAGGAFLECATPVERHQHPRNTVFNVAYGFVSAWIRLALAPAVGIAVTLLVNNLAAAGSRYRHMGGN